MTSAQGPVAILGGAFDPVHFGHLRTAFELQAALQLAEIRFIPTGTPPHREAHVASGELRVQMLERALQDIAWAYVDDRELQRAGPSWSVLTLEELREQEGVRSLCLILGMDAFLGLPDWHRWESLPELAHLIVAHRPGWSPPREGPLGDLLNDRQTRDWQALHDAPSGSIYVHAVTQLEISSSSIREGIAAGLAPRYLVPDSVAELISKTECYAGP